jgi:DNA-binding transcriptional regulator YhcF (GntR family)
MGYVANYRLAAGVNVDMLSVRKIAEQFGVNASTVQRGGH